ncbi:hypothetical protein Droror1_Dr00027600 [Drosera rotundifolia]
MLKTIFIALQDIMLDKCWWRDLKCLLDGGWMIQCADVRLLVIFCVISLINYIDRGAIASNGVNGSRRTCTESGSCIGSCIGGSGIQRRYNLSNFEDGVLSAFMIGLLVASPIFASLVGLRLLSWFFQCQSI